MDKEVRQTMIEDIIFSPGQGLANAPGGFANSIGKSFNAHILGVAFAYVPITHGPVMANMPSKIIGYPLVGTDEQPHSAVDRFEHVVRHSDVSDESLTLKNPMPAAPIGLG